MKKFSFLFLTLFFISHFSFSQAPQGINYQGVARNAAGQALGMQALNVRFTVLQSGASVYVETHAVSTDTFGLYNAVIGQGSPQLGTFSTINWALGNYAVQVEIDPGTGYQNVGSMSLMSVPYSLYTQNAANTAAIQNQAVSAVLPQPGDVLQYNAGIWSPAAPPAGGVTSVTGTPPLTVLNSTTSPVIAMPQANSTTDGFLAQTDWNLFTNKFNSITIPLNSGLMPVGVHSSTVSLSADTAKPFWNAGYILGNRLSGIPLANDVLRFNGTEWVPGSVGGLPAPSAGSILFTDPSTNIWQATNPSYVSSDGNSLTVVNTTTVGTAGTFITNNSSASAVPALKAQSNSSTGYALWADNTAGAAILATSPGPYALTGDLSFGGGNAVVGRLLNSSNGNAILGSVDGTSFGTAGYFVNVNAANDSITLLSFTNSKGPAFLAGTQGLGDAGVFVVDNAGSPGSGVIASTNGSGKAVYGINMGTGYAGAFTINNPSNDSAAVGAVTNGNGSAVYAANFGNGPAGKYEVWNPASTAPALTVSTMGAGPSGIFSGGAGLETDRIRITGPATPTLGAVLTSDAFGNATWQTTSASMPPGTGGELLYNNSGTWVTTNTTSLTFTGTNLGIGQSIPLAPLDIASTHTATSMNAVNTGSGSAGTFLINNAASTADAVMATTNGAAGSKGVSGKHTGTSGGYGVFGEATGSGGAAGVYGYASNGFGTNNSGVAGFNQNPSSGNGVFGQGLYGVQGQTISSAGFGVYGIANTAGSIAVGGLANQTSGRAGDFQITNTSNPSIALTAGTAGTGPAATFSVTSAGNSAPAIIAGTSGTGKAGEFNINSSTNTNDALSASTAGTGRAASFTNSNPMNTLPALYVSTAGTGPAVFVNGGFNINNKFLVDINGNPTAINGVATNFPTAQGTTGTFLQNDGFGNLSWASASAAAWGTTGNAGTIDGTNFIGTTDNVPLTIRVNNVIAARINPTISATSFGYEALTTASGTGNTAFGYQTMQNTTGQRNTAMGYWAMNKTTSGTQNVAIGTESMFTNTTGGSNVSVGFQAMYYHQSGYYNTGIGAEALLSSTTGSNNTAVGYDALFTVTTGTANTAVGYQALGNAGGSANSALGDMALWYVTTGVNNVGVGYNAGVNSNSGSNNTFIGANSGFPTTTQRNNATAIGYNAKVDQDNSLVLGDVGTSVGIGTSMPGALLDIGPSTATLTLRATSTSTGAGTVAYFDNTSSTNNAAVLVSLTNGTGPAGDFKNANSANPQNTLSSTTNGSGSALIATNTGTGRAAFFEINYVSANSSDALYAATFGTGRGAWIEVNNTGSTSDALHATTNGTGAAVNAVNSGGGVAVRGFTTGNSNAGYFQVNNTGSNNPALYTTTNGNGAALMAQASPAGFSGEFTGGKGMKTDGFTAMLKMHPGGTLTLVGTDCFLIIQGGVSGSVGFPPASATNTGKVYVIKNLQGAAFPSSPYITINGTSINSIPAQASVRLISDGVNWQAW